jgi:uncharacterized membrane protein YczE
MEYLRIRTLTEISLARWIKLLLGFAGIGLGVTFMKQSQLGLSPWEVLHDGISKVSGYQLGTVSIFIGALVLILWIPMGEKPGIGTVLNILLIGTVTNLTLPIVPLADQILVQVLWLILGLLGIGLGTALYLNSRLGAGPRDGLMLGFYRRTGQSIRLVRTVLEIIVLVIGWRLGGTLGFGTLAYALTIGPIIQLMFRFLGDHELASNQRNKPA